MLSLYTLVEDSHAIAGFITNILLMYTIVKFTVREKVLHKKNVPLAGFITNILLMYTIVKFTVREKIRSVAPSSVHVHP
ncbi:hypothetical protein PRIPAC_78859 [Pristionchus pacificus]|uniref:Uncharacterized protein n=1 Tax=Pristionchus pacificus TaxID=54126 RepID=A0A2A6CPH8_PRIPA|nr:hypothetical protein PRIPAC_78859 [Pristionchus pacificus]|eukprot:PDM80094.1 hypothetical protein PRIPAC_32673 [Pristionchus pacificus]